MQPKHLLSLAYFAALCVASPVDAINNLPAKRQDQQQFTDADFIDPRKNGGSLLNRSGSGGEPLNVIISGRSSPYALTSEGFAIWNQAIGFAKGCFGVHSGDPQEANLGDGAGFIKEAGVWRQHFNVIGLGSCIQSLTGSNHFREYGPQKGSGAYFLAVSDELELALNHKISPDGYNIGRNDLVTRATKAPARFLGDEFTTNVKMIEGLLAAGAEGVNHGISQDGKIALLTITHRKLAISEIAAARRQFPSSLYFIGPGLLILSHVIL